MTSVAKCVSINSKLIEQVEAYRVGSNENFSEVVARALNELLNKDAPEKFSDDQLKKQYEDARLLSAAIDMELRDRAKKKEEAERQAVADRLKAEQEAAIKNSNEKFNEILNAK